MQVATVFSEPKVRIVLVRIINRPIAATSSGFNIIETSSLYPSLALLVFTRPNPEDAANSVDAGYVGHDICQDTEQLKHEIDHPDGVCVNPFKYHQEDEFQEREQRR